MSNGRRALVTGASSGIGLAVARMLLADGWAVLGASRTQAPIRHERFRWAMADVSLGYQAERLHRFLHGGPLDALVHCAATQGPVGPLEDADAVAWLGCVRTNLVGAFHVVKTALSYLHESDDGRILLFAGGGAFNPRPNYSAYAASKAGVVGLMETLAEELNGTTVTANCVSPGFVPTPIHAASLEAGPGVIGQDVYAHVEQKMAEDDGTALERAVACVRHLLSEEARGLTGKTVSAEWDDWRAIGLLNVEGLNDSPVWTQTRLPALKAPALV